MFLVAGTKVVQVEYKKEWMDTYLWVLSETQIQDSYIEKMLLHNQGEGRLEFSKQQKEGEEYYCYKITGKKSLNSVYSMMTIGERQIRGILQQLFTALENGKEYLLVEEDFVLSPSYIFATFPQIEMELCYVPGYNIPLKEQLEGLFEYLLNRVDYDDKKAVELLYNCYMFCVKEQGGLKEIKALLVEQHVQDNVVEQQLLLKQREEDRNVILKPREILEENKKYLEEDKEKVSYSTQIEDSRQIEKEKKKTVLKNKKQIIYPEAEESKKVQTMSYMSWFSNLFFPKQKSLIVAEEKEEYQIQPVKEEKIEESERTILLSAIQEKEEVVLVCNNSGEIIPITKFPFYIGSTSDYVDYVLKKEGVSRIHCCISKKGECYYVADLNSTNGTYLNKKEVIPGKDELLSANDEIRIASVEFYMKFSCH